MIRNLSDFNWKNSSWLFWESSEFIASHVPAFAPINEEIRQIMLIGHRHPVDSIDNWAFPLIRDNIKRIMSVSSSWLKQIMHFFVDYLNEFNLHAESEVGVQITRSASVLSVSFVFEEIENIISEQRNKAGIWLISFNRMWLSWTSWPVHQNWNVHTFSQGS